MEPGLIPSSAVIGYLRYARGETDPHEIDTAIRMVRAIDLEWMAANRKPENA